MMAGIKYGESAIKNKHSPININIMRDWLRTLLAGYAGYKWGGGCLGFIVVFAIVYWLLGHC